MSKAKKFINAKKIDESKEVKKAIGYIEDALGELVEISGSETGTGGAIYKTMDLLRKALMQAERIKG